MPLPLIRELFEGPLDVIGDVHGEREALEVLLERLGYDAYGRHRQQRRVVFVGDLCDRGPDSPGTLRLVRELIDRGVAQAVAGNHELNLLRGERKHGNHWFFGHREHAEFGSGVALADQERGPLLDFLRTLPVVLERPDLRVVHAAWTDETIGRLRGIETPLDVADAHFEELLRRDPAFRALEARRAEELDRLGAALGDPGVAPRAETLGAYEVARQSGHPLRIVTSGIERLAPHPFYAAGKWRYAHRVAWWKEYEGEVPVLFGHYWRSRDPAAHAILSPGEPALFADDPLAPFMADHHLAYCIDFSVGARYRQRVAGDRSPPHGHLAAIRWPERRLVFDSPADA